MATLTSEGLATAVEAEVRGQIAAMRQEDPDFRPWLGIATDSLYVPREGLYVPEGAESEPALTPVGRYVDALEKAAHATGLVVERSWVMGGADDIEERVHNMNDKSRIDGIVVATPFGDPDDKARIREVLAQIDPDKDVDDLTGEHRFLSGTTRAIARWMAEWAAEREIDLGEAHTAVIGNLGTVGGAIYRHLDETGTTTVAGFDRESDPADMAESIEEADFVISATGQAGLLTLASFRNRNRRRLVFDVGTSVGEDGTMGDTSADLQAFAATHPNFELTSPRNGLGPVTTRMVVANTFDAAVQRWQARVNA